MELVRSKVNGYQHPDDPGEPGTKEPRMSINETECKILAELVRGLDNVAEIGTGLGVSAVAMSVKAKRIVTTDIDPWVIETIVPTLPANVEFMARDKLDLRKAEFDACFIDSLHTVDQCLLDIDTARDIVKPGGLIIFHDTYLTGVAEALKISALPFVHIQSKTGMGMAWNE